MLLFSYLGTDMCWIKLTFLWVEGMFDYWNQLNFITCEVIGDEFSFYEFSPYEEFPRNEF